MPNNTEDIKYITETGRKQPKLLKKTLLEMKLMDAGETAENALKIVNNKDKVHKQSVYALERKYKKYSLSKPNMAKLANNQVKRILKAEPRERIKDTKIIDGQVVEIKEEIVPSDTNILSAAMMVYDRYEPTRSQESSGDTYNTYIDLSNYRNHE